MRINRISNFIKNNWIFFLFVLFLTVKQYIFYIIVGFTPFTFPPKTHLLSIPGITILILSFIFLIKKQSLKIKYLIAFDIFLTFILIVNLLYYRYFYAPISFFCSSQLMDLIDTKKNIAGSIRVSDMIYFAGDFFILPFILKNTKYKENTDLKNNNKSIKLFIFFFVTGLFLYMIKPVKRSIMGEEILTNFDPLNNIVALTPVVYQGYDLFNYFFSFKKIKLNQEQEIFVKNTLKENEILNEKELKKKSKYYGAGRNCNLILIQVESLDNSVIKKRWFNKEITPFINKYLEENIYFPDFYSQIAGGSTSDAEFVINTSLYPLIKGSVFYRFPLNRYNSLAYILKKHRYTTIAIHANRKSFWNRHLVFPSLFFDKYYSIEDFKNGEIIGMGLSDADMFSQTISILKKAKKPFYAHIITLTSHIPFIMPEKYKLLYKNYKNESKLTDYLNSINWTDKIMEDFFNKLKTNNLDKNSVIVIVGDHDAPGLEKAIKKYEFWQPNRFRNVPLIIHIPGIKRQVINTTGGFIDLLPTLLYILGIDKEEYIKTSLGKNLFLTERNYTLIPLLGGIVVGDEDNNSNKIKLLNDLEASRFIIHSNFFSNKFDRYNNLKY